VSGIVEFLRARWTEARALAEAARDGNWDFKPYPPLEVGGDPVQYEAMMARVGFIEALQPGQTLADLDAKLAILDWYEVASTSPELNPDAWQIMRQVLLRLAVPFAAHPDYDERWRP
jgi:hypothetical protein